MYSTSENAPSIDSNNAYNTTWSINSDGSVWFRSERFLTPPAGYDETYVIELGTASSMICAYLTTQPDLDYHGINKFGWEMTIYEDGSSSTAGGGSAGFVPRTYFGLDAWSFHGLLMWISWSLLGLIQLSSTRYLKHKYSWNKTLHAISGFLLTCTVVTSFTIVFKANEDLFIINTFHTAFGNITVWCGVMVMLGGLTAELTRRYADMSWRTSIVLLISKFHGWFGYFVLLVS